MLLLSAEGLSCNWLTWQDYQHPNQHNPWPWPCHNTSCSSQTHLRWHHLAHGLQPCTVWWTTGVNDTSAPMTGVHTFPRALITSHYVHCCSQFGSTMSVVLSHRALVVHSVQSTFWCRPALIRSSLVEEYSRGSWVPFSRINFIHFLNYMFKIPLALIASSVFNCAPWVWLFLLPTQDDPKILEMTWRRQLPWSLLSLFLPNILLSSLWKR